MKPQKPEDVLVEYFPDFESKKSYESRRRYIEDRLSELASAGTLRLTPLFSMPDPIPDMAGEALSGVLLERDQERGKDRRSGRIEIPHELAGYKVRIRTLPRTFDMIAEDEYSDPVQTPWSIKCKLPAREAPRQRLAPDGQIETFYVLEPRQFDARSDDRFEDPTDIVIEAPMAWRILKQSGKNCRRAVRATMQRGHQHADGQGNKHWINGYWKCEEVPLDAAPREKPKQNRRGRPPKSAQSEAATQ